MYIGSPTVQVQSRYVDDVFADGSGVPMDQFMQNEDDKEGEDVESASTTAHSALLARMEMMEQTMQKVMEENTRLKKLAQDQQAAGQSAALTLKNKKDGGEGGGTASAQDPPPRPAPASVTATETIAKEAPASVTATETIEAPEAPASVTPTETTAKADPVNDNRSATPQPPATSQPVAAAQAQLPKMFAAKGAPAAPPAAPAGVPKKAGIKK